MAIVRFIFLAISFWEKPPLYKSQTWISCSLSQDLFCSIRSIVSLSSLKTVPPVPLQDGHFLVMNFPLPPQIPQRLTSFAMLIFTKSSPHSPASTSSARRACGVSVRISNVEFSPYARSLRSVSLEQSRAKSRDKCGVPLYRLFCNTKCQRRSKN